MKRLLILLALASTCRGADAEHLAERLDLHFSPWPLHLKPREEAPDPSQPGVWPLPRKEYPLVPNRVADCLPGKLYNVRGFFEEQGAKFSGTGFAWYSPEASILAVRAAPADADFVAAVLHSGSYGPPVNLRLTGEVVVQPVIAKAEEAKAEIPPAQRLGFDYLTKSGQRSTFSALGEGKLTYSCEIEPTLETKESFIDYNIVVKVTFEKREYTTSTSATATIGKRHSLLLGTTVKGEEVRFQMTPKLEHFEPASPLDDAAVKKRILTCIEQALKSNEP